MCQYCRFLDADLQDCQGEWLCYQCFVELVAGCQLCYDLEREYHAESPEAVSEGGLPPEAAL